MISTKREWDFYLIFFPTFINFSIVYFIIFIDLFNYFLVNYFYVELWCGPLCFLDDISLWSFSSSSEFYSWDLMNFFEFFDFNGEIISINVRAVCFFYSESTKLTFFGVILSLTFFRWVLVLAVYNWLTYCYYYFISRMLYDRSICYFRLLPRESSKDTFFFLFRKSNRDYPVPMSPFDNFARRLLNITNYIFNYKSYSFILFTKN